MSRNILIKILTMICLINVYLLQYKIEGVNMEIFEVTFRGKKVKAVKDSAGQIYIRVPNWKAKNGKIIDEIISGQPDGWKYEFIPNLDFDNAFELWIRNDGRIAYNTKKSGRIIVSEQPFNPDSPNVGKLNVIVAELYRTVEQLKVYEQRNIPASTIIKLRRCKLLSTLNLLGYENVDDVGVELEDSQMKFELRRIGEKLKKYINLGAYVHVERKENDEDVIKLNIPEGMTKEEFLEMVEPVKNEYLEEKQFAEEQAETREEKRDILPDYCAHARRKMPQAEWLLYTSILRETAKLLLELNADILESNQKIKIPDLSQLTEKELEDRISKLINSKDFSKACEVEKTFLVRETKKLTDELGYQLGELVEQGKSTSIGETLQNMLQKENEFIRELTAVEPKKTEGIGIDD